MSSAASVLPRSSVGVVPLALFYIAFFLAPISILIFDTAGNLYGTTLDGGANGFGTVFKMTPSKLGSPASLQK